jgi:hypothetical protein
MSAQETVRGHMDSTVCFATSIVPSPFSVNPFAADCFSVSSPGVEVSSRRIDASHPC